MELKVYRRPDRQWKCGLHASGSACPLGPDERGRCHSKKCHPQRTLRWWRSYLPIAFAVATLGIAVTLVVTQQHREIIAPGPLSNAHAQLILNPSDPHRCVSCHDNSTGTFSKASMDSKFVADHTQTERCLVCHVRELPQLKRATPHDLTVEELELLTAAAKAEAASTTPDWSLASFVKSHPIDWHQHQLACSSCHREHQGANHDLQAIASQRCQACHQNQFDSFSDGHPEFTNYPVDTPGRLAFDHMRHRDLHFAKSTAQFDCRVCHLNGAEQGRVGQVFRSVNFETACASCHLAPMKASLPDGVIVYQLPSLDIRGLAQRGSKIDTWPEEAGQLLDGSIPPLMRLLLAGDLGAESFSQQFLSTGKLTDFNIDDGDDRQALTALADASRRLLAQLASGGQQTLRDRLTAIANPDDRELIDRFMQGVPPDLFRQAYRDWFEVAEVHQAPQNGLRVSTKGTTKNETEFDDFKSTISQDDLLSGDTDDPKSILTSSVSDSLLDNSLLTDDPLGADASSRNTSIDKPNIDFSVASWKTLKARQHLLAGGWMIDRQRMAIIYVPTGHADPWLTAVLTLGRQLKETKNATALDAFAAKSIMDVEELTNSLLAKDGVGRCTECHRSLNTVESAPASISKLVTYRGGAVTSTSSLWHAERFDARVRQLTRFDHGPHLIQPSLTDCVACHRMESEKNNSTISHHRDFQPMKTQDCASCHRSQAAGDNCTQCHNYHTNGISP